MSKKRSIISYDKLNIEQKKQLLIAFPDGFAASMTKMNNPITGESMDALLWETEEIIYLVKLPKVTVKQPSVEEDDDDFDEEIDKFDGKEDEEESTDDDEEDSYGDDPADEPAAEEEDED